MTQSQATKLLLKKQDALRRQSWTTDQLISYAKGWSNASKVLEK